MNTITQQQSQNLNNSYSKLISDRKQIKKTLNDFQVVDEQYNDSMLYVEKNKSQYMLWVAFTIFICFYLFKVVLFPNIQINIFRMLFWFFLILLFLLSGIHIGTSSGFLMFGIIIILFFVE